MAKKSIPAQKKKAKEISLFVKITAGVVLIALIALFVLPTVFTGSSGEEEYMFKKEGELVITDSLGNSKIRLNIEIADTEFDRQLGLMFRKSMEETQGMFFDFPGEEMHSFWMRNTFIPLDIIFINDEKQIITIHKRTEPLSANHYPSSEPAKYVLEVNAGFTDRYGIKEGDRVEYTAAE